MSVIHCLSLPMHISPKSLHWHSGPKYKTSTITFQKITNLFMSELSKEALGTASIERDTVTTHTHNISMIKYLLAARADNSGGWQALSEHLWCSNTDWLFFLFFPNLPLPGYLMHSSKQGLGAAVAGMQLQLHWRNTVGECQRGIVHLGLENTQGHVELPVVLLAEAKWTSNA